MPGFAFPSVGPLGFGSPPSRSWPSLPMTLGTMLRYDCPLSFSGRFAFGYRSPIPCPASLSFVSRFRLAAWVGSLPASPRLLVSQYPLSSGFLGGRQLALSSSRFVLLNPCPGLRPRWCPKCSPFRIQDCCLPLFNSVGFPRFALVIFCPHQHIISRLNVTAWVLALLSFRCPLLVLPVSFASGLLARLWPGGTWTSPCFSPHPLDNFDKFQGFSSPFPMSRAFLTQ